MAEEAGALDDSAADCAADHADAFDGRSDHFAGWTHGAGEGRGTLTGADDVGGFEEEAETEGAGFASRFTLEREDELFGRHGLKVCEVDLRIAEEIGFIAKVPVHDADFEVGCDAGFNGDFERLVPGGRECFLLRFGFIDASAVEFELAVGVAFAVAICGWQIGRVEDLDTEGAHVVYAFTWV